MNRNINIQNVTPTPLHGAHDPQVENTTVDQQSGPVSDSRSQEPGLGSQPGPASGIALCLLVCLPYTPTAMMD